MEEEKNKPSQKFKDFLKNQRALKIILNIWTLVTMSFFAVDYFSGNKFDTSSASIGVTYLAILGIYIASKEYTRWQKKRFMSRFLGEGFVGFWTALMIMFVVLTPFSDGKFKVPGEFTVVYTSVIAAFAITQQSKTLHENQEEIKQNDELLPKNQ